MSHSFTNSGLQQSPSGRSLLSNGRQTEEQTEETSQYITFRLNNYRFALPSQAVLRVVATPSPEEGGFISMGVVQLGPYSIQILDLVTLMALPPLERNSEKNTEPQKERAMQESESSQENPPFLLVLQNSKQTEDPSFWGIALNVPPDLMDIPTYALKPVPAHQRLTQSLKWISHIVSYNLNDKRRSLLILDLSLISRLNKDQVHSDTAFEIKEISPPLEMPIKESTPWKR